MQTVDVNLGDRAYAITVRRGLLGEADFENGVVITDRNVWFLYGRQGVDPIIVEPGENSKSIETLSWVFYEMLRRGLSRKGRVIAFGGGVVGDLAGFAASAYMRGVPYIQVPTTLLSQVDSSVGGKTAVNLPGYKNIVGAFHQPSAVLIDPNTLDTLPPRELGCGLAEVIKYGAIRDTALLSPQKLTREEIITRSCAIKARIVENDEREQGERALLNFGHTFGHAVESLGGFSKYNHGEAVGIGMVIAAQIGENLGLTERGTFDNLRGILDDNNLPVSCDFPREKMIEVVKSDKKADGGEINFVFLSKLGAAFSQKIGLEQLVW